MGVPEPNCRREYHLHTDRDLQFRHVASRDGLKCDGCGTSPTKWRRGAVCYLGGEPMTERQDYENPLMFWVLGTRYCSIERVTALELEHARPLWEVAHLDDEARRPYFGPSNLRLMCIDCHKPKTSGEAKARAKSNRMKAMRLDVEKPPAVMRGGSKLPSKGQGRKLQGGGFGQQHRPLRSRNTLRRG